MKIIIFSLVLCLFNMRAVAQSVEIWVEGGQTSVNTCVVTFAATNSSNQTVTFVQKVNFYDRGRNLISTYDLLFENLRPGRTGGSTAYVNNAYCNEITSIAARNMSLCTINGEWKHECPINPSFPNKGAMKITR